MSTLLRRFFLCSLLLLAPGASLASSENKTLFDHAAEARGVGTIRLGKPLPYRQGKVLAFPSRFAKLLWAPKGKPLNLMLVYEVPSDEAARPFFADGDEIFAPIRLLPEHSYWRDNLPNTPRHQVAGGKRNVFRGEEIAEAEKALGPFLETWSIRGVDRRPAQVKAVASALGSTVDRIREDAVAWLSAAPTLGRDLDAEAAKPVSAYLEGGAPASEKAALVLAVSRAGATAVVSDSLKRLSAGDDASAAAALRALDAAGSGAATVELLARSKSASVEMRAFAAEALGARSATDPEASARARQLLGDASEADAVRAGAAAGLGRAGGAEAVASLLAAVSSGDASSRPAALALARIGSPEVVNSLSGILTSTTGEAAASAAYGLSRIPGCEECGKILAVQREQHPDPGVKALIGTQMELPVEEKR